MFVNLFITWCINNRNIHIRFNILCLDNYKIYVVNFFSNINGIIMTDWLGAWEADR